jgi:phosphomethylpyrimidine synthase
MNIPTPKITTDELPASRKIYVNGTLHADVRVPMREISVHPTAGEAPLPVYDSSGAYTDPNILTDIKQGRPRWNSARSVKTSFVNWRRAIVTGTIGARIFPTM